MKMSLRLMICTLFSGCLVPLHAFASSYVFVSQVFQEFELAVCTL